MRSSFGLRRRELSSELRRCVFFANSVLVNTEDIVDQKCLNKTLNKLSMANIRSTGVIAGSKSSNCSEVSYGKLMLVKI